MRLFGFGLAALLGGCVGIDAAAPEVELIVSGPPIPASEAMKGYLYKAPKLRKNSDLLAQRWSMLGREDRAASANSAEYRPAHCEALPEAVSGEDTLIDIIAKRAADHRIVIINESHTVTRHRNMTRRLLPRLRAQGFTVLAAETFENRPGENDTVVKYAALPYPHIRLGHYSQEAAFGRLLRDAKALGYRFAAYEQIYIPNAGEGMDRWQRITAREEEQAGHLTKILAAMGPEEKLLIHVGYSHAREASVTEEDGRVSRWMAARLKEKTGLDPLTITQTGCRRGSDAAMRLASPPAEEEGWYDLIIDHPIDSFTKGRVQWRRDAGDQLVPIPAQLRPVDAPLVIEAFAWGEPFDSTPVDRVYVEPGEDIPLSLPPGRYTVRAVHLSEE